MSAIMNSSLFIPHVFPNFDKNYVAEAFSEVGDVERVDFVAKQDRIGKQYNAAYIHFKKWYNNHFAAKILVDIEDNGTTKFYHDDSEYYWIVLPNTAKKQVPGERKPRIDLGEDKSISANKTPKKPILKRSEHFVPEAPKKPTYAELAAKPLVNIEPSKLETEFDNILEELAQEAEIEEIEAELRTEFAQMEEIDAELAAEDENLVSIDYRYVQAIEQENMWLHGEIAQLRAALINLDQMYQAEAAKVRAFSSVETSVDL